MTATHALPAGMKRIIAWLRSWWTREQHSCATHVVQDVNTGDIFCGICGRDLT